MVHNSKNPPADRDAEPPVGTRPRVLLLVSEDRFFWSHRLSIARAAQRGGYEVIVATKVSRYGQEIRDEGFRLIPLRLVRNNSSLLDEWRALQELRRIYKTEKPHIVHHFAVKPVLYGSIAALRRKEVQAIDALTGLGYLVASSSIRARFWRPIIWNALRYLLNRPGHHIILQNDEDKELLVKKLSVPPDRITVIRGSGVDVEAFQPTPEPTSIFTVVLASRMLWIKGIQEFVEAAHLLLNRNLIARFILVGDSDSRNPSCVPREQLIKWQESGVVEWWGQRENIGQIFEKSNLVCLPSHGGEGVPKVLLEAAASGRAIVTTDVPGCRDIVRDGINGLLVPRKDPAALARAILQLANNSELRRQMALRGREIVVQEFSEDVVINQTLALYRRLLEL